MLYIPFNSVINYLAINSRVSIVYKFDVLYQIVTQCGIVFAWFVLEGSHI